MISVNADMTGLISVGNRIKLTQTTVKYFIVTAVGSYAGGATLITVYGGTDYTLANAAITSPSYSSAKSPFGFPMSPTKWQVEVIDTTNRSQASPTQNQWYNLNSAESITIPIGAWRVEYYVILYVNIASGTSAYVKCSLSTSNNSDSDTNFLSEVYVAGATGGVGALSAASKSKNLILASKTPYYLVTMTPDTGMANIGNNGGECDTIIRAICTYL